MQLKSSRPGLDSSSRTFREDVKYETLEHSLKTSTRSRAFEDGRGRSRIAHSSSTFCSRQVGVTKSLDGSTSSSFLEDTSSQANCLNCVLWMFFEFVVQISNGFTFIAARPIWYCIRDLASVLHSRIANTILEMDGRKEYAISF